VEIPYFTDAAMKVIVDHSDFLLQWFHEVVTEV
jgi:hypothetical protein